MKLFKKYILATVILSLVLTICSTTSDKLPVMRAAAANEGQQLTVTGETVNIRDGASLSKKKLSSAKKGAKFPVLGTAKDSDGTLWYMIYTSSGQGYVISTYVSVASDKVQTLTVNADKVNVRTMPGTGYPSIAKVNKGAKFSLLASEKDTAGKTWYKIYIGQSQFGYIIDSYASLSTASSNTGAASTTAATPAASDSTLTVTGDKVNVRSGAGTGNKAVTTVKKGQTYKVEGTAKDSAGKVWYKITVGGQSGFVISDYVSVKSSGTSSTTASTAAANGDSTLTVTGSKVNVRSGAGTGNKAVTSVSKGQTFKVEGSAKDSAGKVWYKITVGGQQGYIISDYVSVKSSGTTASTTAKATSAAADSTLTVTANKVNVRKGAGTGNKAITTVNKGQTYKVEGSAKDSSGKVWYKITVNGQQGYIICDYAKVTGSATSATSATAATSVTNAAEQQLTVTGSLVNVREGAGTDKKKVTTVAKNQVFKVEGSAKDSAGKVWYKITVSGKPVYICGDYAKLSAAPTTATTTAASATTTTTTTVAAVSGADAPTSASTTTTVPSSTTTTTASSTTSSATGTMATTTTKAVGAGSANIQKVTYGTITTNGGTLNVRKSASTDAKSLGTLKNGAKVTIVESPSGWHKIKYGDGYGYVSAKYVTGLTSTTQLTSLAFKTDYYLCNVGQTVNIAINGNGMAVTYTSKDPTNAPISADGVVTGKAVGMYGITAKCGDLTAECNIIVTKPGYQGVTPMSISEAGTSFIAQWEGGGKAENGELHFYPYKDTVGYWTIGYGHAKTTQESKSWSKERATAEFNKDIESLIGAEHKLTGSKGYLTEAEAQSLLHADLNKGDYVKAVSDWMVRNGVKLTQQQFDALVSFCYNLGPAYWTSDTKLFYLKGAILCQRCGSDANKDQIIEGFCRYIKASGQNLTGLWYRRRNEAELFLENDYKLDWKEKFTLPTSISWDK